MDSENPRWGNISVSYSSVLQGKAKPVKILKRGQPLDLPPSDEPIPENEELYQGPSSNVNNSLPAANERRRSKNKPSPMILSEFVLNVPSTSKHVASSSGFKPKKVEENVKNSSNNKKVVTGNLLDSSAPQFHKGKYRENANKKPSTMKKIILKDREERKLKNQPNLSLQRQQICRFNEETPEHDLNVEQIEQGSKTLPTEETSASTEVVRRIHSRKFRNYCDNVVTDELNQTISLLITELGRFQDRQHAKDAEKAKLKRRMVCGLREVKKLVKVERIRFLIVAPNIEQGENEGGLNDVLGEILNDCKSQNVPYLFAMSRQSLGFVTRKRRPLSVVGILNYQGAEQHFKHAMELLVEARAKYEEVKFFADGGINTDVEKFLPVDKDYTVPSVDDSLLQTSESRQIEVSDKSVQVNENLPSPCLDYSSSTFDLNNLNSTSNHSFKILQDASSSTDDETIILVNNFNTIAINQN